MPSDEPAVEGPAEHPPRLVYDDDCGFCTWCAVVALQYGEFEAVAFSALTPDQRARLPADYETCTHLLTDDAVYSCGEAVERALARLHPALDVLFDALRPVPGYASLRERLYRWAAARRAWWGRIVSASPPATACPGDRCDSTRDRREHGDGRLDPDDDRRDGGSD